MLLGAQPTSGFSPHLQKSTRPMGGRYLSAMAGAGGGGAWEEKHQSQSRDVSMTVEDRAERAY